MQGTVKFFNTEKGFGFISAEDGKDYFFHCTDISNEEKVLEKGQKVSFKPFTGKNRDNVVKTSAKEVTAI